MVSKYELLNDEEIVYEAKIHFIVILPHCLLMLIGIGFFTLIYTLLKMLTTRFIITDNRMLVKSGILRSYTIDIPLSKINSIIVKQSLFGRAFNYGNFIIATSSEKTCVKLIVNPDFIRYLILEEIEMVLKIS